MNLSVTQFELRENAGLLIAGFRVFCTVSATEPWLIILLFCLPTGFVHVAPAWVIYAAFNRVRCPLSSKFELFLKLFSLILDFAFPINSDKLCSELLAARRRVIVVAR